MSDAKLRELERRLAHASNDDTARYIAEAIRSGLLRDEDVRLAASLGDLRAKAARPDEAEAFMQFPTLVERIIERGRTEWVRVGLALAERALLTWQSQEGAGIPDDRPRRLVEGLRMWATSPSPERAHAVAALHEDLRQFQQALPPHERRTADRFAGRAALNILVDAGELVNAPAHQAQFLLTLMISAATTSALGVVVEDSRAAVRSETAEQRVLMLLAEALLPGLTEPRT